MVFPGFPRHPRFTSHGSPSAEAWANSLQQPRSVICQTSCAKPRLVSSHVETATHYADSNSHNIDMSWFTHIKNKNEKQKRQHHQIHKVNQANDWDSSSNSAVIFHTPSENRTCLPAVGPSKSIALTPLIFLEINHGNEELYLHMIYFHMWLVHCQIVFLVMVSRYAPYI